MSSTRTYMMRAKDKPDWMIIAPINPLTEQQWKVLYVIIRLLEKRESDWPINSATVRDIVQHASFPVSTSTVRKTLKKLCDMGLIRRSGRRNSGGYVYYRKVTV